MKINIILAAIAIASLGACSKEKSDPAPATGPNIVFKFKFDSTQARLNAIGQPSVMPVGNAGQSPVFNGMSAHYIELAPGDLTPLGSGAVLYKAAETTAGGSTAIDFDKATVAGNGEVFYSMPLKSIAAGDYKWLRISLAYQNYDVKFNVDTVVAGIPFKSVYTGTVASFIGFNSYIKSYKVKTDTITVNGNRKQGYWGLESTGTIAGVPQTIKTSGQAPDGATTVVNPNPSSPIPPGSCVVTAVFMPGKLTITGTETKDIVVEVSLSINKSFEWKEVLKNGQWDPLKGEAVVDMGVRGMIPTVK